LGSGDDAAAQSSKGQCRSSWKTGAVTPANALPQVIFFNSVTADVGLTLAIIISAPIEVFSHRDAVQTPAMSDTKNLSRP